MMRRVLSMLVAFCVGAQAHAQQQPTPPIVGRWNLTVRSARGSFPSWLEVEQSGFAALVGRFVGRIGAARPIGRIEWADGTVRFSIPPQWEGTADLRLEGRLDGDSLSGTILHPSGMTMPFSARRAPTLLRPAPAAWSAPKPLFNGRDVSGWRPVGMGTNNWVVRDGMLANTRAGMNLATTETFADFKLHVEFRLPPKGDGGIFLRGRYEVQIGDRAESGVPGPATTGAIYGFLIPNENAQTGPGGWQTLDATLVGRRVTIVVNGRPVIVDQIIPGLTGSALDADEAAPGPIALQGEETAIEFRNILISVPAPVGAGTSATPATCAADDAEAVAAVRARLGAWVSQVKADDRAGMRDIWAPGMVGWFPTAAIFSDSAAFAVAGVTRSGSVMPRTTYDITIDDIVASGDVVVVHDLWTEMRELNPQTSVRRSIRGSELWRCQPDGKWRIARYVSAPEPWTLITR